jgi:hypothetical protein
MVLSRLNNQLTYNESRGINKKDLGAESSIYELTLFDKTIIITLGKPDYLYSSKNIIYFSIYSVNDENAIDSCIGVYEIKKDDILKIYDDENDIDIAKLGEPLLFLFTEDFIKNMNTDVKNYLNKWEKPVVISETIKENDVNNMKNDNNDNDNDDNNDNDNDNDVFNLGKVKSEDFSYIETEIDNESENIDNKINGGGLFEDDNDSEHKHHGIVLVEETEKDANSIKREYTNAQSHNWVQKFMKNVNYDIHDIKLNNDSIFLCICDAYKQIGKITSVSKLRSMVADSITDKKFVEYKDSYLMTSGTIKKNENELKRIKTKVSPDLKRKANTADKHGNKPELEKIIEEGKIIKRKYDKLLSENRELSKILKEMLGDLEDINSLDRFKRFIQTINFNPDESILSLIELKMNLKFIILSEQSYNDNDLANALLCSIKSNVKTPEFYIIVSVMKNRYSLVSYKNKKILEFFEIPYYMKTLVINKCMERNSGDFYAIEDFKNFKTRLGVNVNIGEPQQDNSNELYDSDTVFMFYERSSGEPYPGKGSGEKINNSDIKEYVELSTKSFYDWRKKLDDSWKKSPFSINGKTYMSVTHYYNGSKFKHGFPDFFDKFNIESGSEISTDVNMAKIAGSIDGILSKGRKTKNARPKNITIDPEFYPDNSKKIREDALRAKFTQHIDLAAILKNTKQSKLIRYSINQPAYIDILLMKIRRELF